MRHVHRAGRRVQPDRRPDAVGCADQSGAVRRLHGGHDAWPCLGHGQSGRVHCAGGHRCAGAGQLPGRPVCHLRQDRRLRHRLHSDRAADGPADEGAGPQVLVALRGDGRGLCRLLRAGHDLVHDADRC